MLLLSIVLLQAHQPDNLLQDKERKECFALVQKHCPKMEDSTTFQECLRKNFSKLSKACSYMWGGTAMKNPIADFCYDDLQKYCPDMTKLRSCLRANMSKFSKKCQRSLQDVARNKMNKIRSDCQNDLVQLCPQEKKDDEQLRCLSKHVDKLSKKCIEGFK